VKSPARRAASAALIAFVAVLAIAACQPQKEGAAGSGDATALQTDDEKTLYALGLALARNLEPFNLTEPEVELVKQGIADGALKREPKVKLEEQAQNLQNFAKARQQSAAAEEVKASEAFLAQAAAAAGAEKTASGLIYQELKAGSGESPQPTDTVKVHYHGTLRDGSVFDSSVDRGQPAQFPLNRVIPCWTEGVAKMKPGGEALLTCPASIAYGERGAPPKIKPGAALAFKVTLLEVTKTPEAAALPPGHPPTGAQGDAAAAKPTAKKPETAKAPPAKKD
jgi:FKBP-type peptidyl-prolyl cis-trans isomerase FkpA